MSTTILETPTRLLKLTDCNKKTCNKSIGVINKFTPLRGLLETSEKARVELVPYVGTMTIHDAVSSAVHVLRDPIADLQEKRGVSKNQHYSFIELMIALFQQSYNAVVAIFTMLFGLLPLLEGLLTLCRFMLDKILEINDTHGTGEKIFKLIVFIAELIIIFVVVMLIMSVIILPVFYLVEYNFRKIMAMARS